MTQGDILKPLRDKVYILQKKLHRPQAAIPEEFKSINLRLCSNILSWSFDQEYICPEDIKLGIDKYMKIVTEKSVELEELEKKGKEDHGTFCFAKTSDSGTYGLVKRSEVEEKRRQCADVTNCVAGSTEESTDLEWKAFQQSGPINSFKVVNRHGRCACMGLTDGHMDALLDLMKSWEDVEVFDLRGNKLQDAGMQRLVLGLSSPSMLPNLRTLRVGGNESGPLGAQVIIGLSYLRKDLEVCADWDENERDALTREAEEAILKEESSHNSDFAEDREGAEDEKTISRLGRVALGECDRGKTEVIKAEEKVINFRHTEDMDVGETQKHANNNKSKNEVALFEMD